MLKFNQFFSFEDYQSIYNEYINNNYKFDLFDQKLYQFLIEKVKLGELSLPLNSETHENNMLYYFDKLINNKINDSEFSNLSYIFSKILLYSFSDNKKSLTNELNNNNIDSSNLNFDSYISFTNKITEGDFGRHQLEHSSDCFKCGRKINLESKKWQFELFTFYKDINLNKYIYEKLNDCIQYKLHNFNVNFDSGELLIADWFRFTEFNDFVKNDVISINNIQGQIDSTLYAASLNYVTINVGNSSPKIYQDGNKFIFGHENYKNNNNTLKPMASVCTDLWNVTIIDKAYLISILSQKLSKNEATKMLDDYIKKNDVNVINVEPGNYNISFSPSKYINQFDKNINPSIETLFSMEKISPSIKNKPKF